ncbi:hypothetical protein CDL15_Pgr011442 [Punica granatum]|uniref:Uncharacterized protein n=1 Tax=Punica granatum TaxID=22663 RepID=A0A218WEN8_PUNGR|nr:hypothetical protein CDL15_Pgr011442 [Punica granatum]
MELNNVRDMRDGYLISASWGDLVKLTNLLQALYHLGSFYLVNFELGTLESNRAKLTRFVSQDPIFRTDGGKRSP